MLLAFSATCTGPRLARGYRNCPEQTAAAYVSNPWFEASTAALNGCDGSNPAAAAALLRQHYRLAYRTSDLVVMGADGQVSVTVLAMHVCCSRSSLLPSSILRVLSVRVGTRAGRFLL
jgi:hypothetical protein